MSARKRERASISVSRIINKRIRYDPAQANRQRAADNAKRLRRYQNIIKRTATDDREHPHHDDLSHYRGHDDERNTKSHTALTTAIGGAGGSGIPYRRRVGDDGSGGAERGDDRGEGSIAGELVSSARRVDSVGANTTALAAASAPTDSFAAARRRRAISHSRYSARTSRGQPRMRGRIFEMLQKIQSKHDERRSEQTNHIPHTPHGAKTKTNTNTNTNTG